jgi:putative transposase
LKRAARQDTIDVWKAKCGGTEVSEAQEAKHLRDENARLKKLVAELILDKDMLQSVIRKNSLRSWSGVRFLRGSSRRASATSAS